MLRQCKPDHHGDYDDDDDNCGGDDDDDEHNHDDEEEEEVSFLKFTSSRAMAAGSRSLLSLSNCFFYDLLTCEIGLFVIGLEFVTGYTKQLQEQDHDE